jgi:hypothetical protein
VFSSRGWTKFALATNLLGTLLLFYSFQATSSSFRLINRPNGPFGQSYEICVGDFTLLTTDGRGSVGLGHKGCPIAANDRPAAVVNIEKPEFVTLGFLLIVAGFIVQFFAVPEPVSIAELRKQVKALKKLQRSGGNSGKEKAS